MGNGKNIFQVGFDFGFGASGEGFKYIMGAMGGTNAAANMFTDIVTGNASSYVTGEAEIKK